MDMRLSNYASLLNATQGTKIPMNNMFALSALGSKTTQAQLKAAGIDTNSKQYKAAIALMQKSAKSGAFANVQGLKNLMSGFDADGDRISPTTGLAGLDVTEQTRDHRYLIDIPEKSKQEMFDLTKKEFLRENGLQNGETTQRSDVYLNMHRGLPKQDRLPAGYTLQQYERVYRQAMYDAALAADPAWKAGDPVPEGALDALTRADLDPRVTAHVLDVQL